MKVKGFMGIYLHFFSWIASHTTNKQTYTTLEYLIFDTVHVCNIIELYKEIKMHCLFCVSLRGHFRFSYNGFGTDKGGCGKFTWGRAEGRD